MIKIVKQRDILTKSEVLDLINNARSFKMQLVIETMVSTGMRVSELINFKINWINFKDRIIHIKKNNEPIAWEPKRGSERRVPVNEDLLSKLKKFIKNRKTGYVFQSQKSSVNGRRTHHRYSYRSIIKKINNLTNKVLGKQTGSHILRATYTTYQLKDGMNILDVKKLLGHSSLKTTERYIGNLPNLHSFEKARASEIMNIKYSIKKENE